MIYRLIVILKWKRNASFCLKKTNDWYGIKDNTTLTIVTTEKRDSKGSGVAFAPHCSKTISKCINRRISQT